MSTHDLSVQNFALMDHRFLGEVREEHLATVDGILRMGREVLVALMQEDMDCDLDWSAENIRRQRNEIVEAARGERLVTGS